MPVCFYPYITRDLSMAHILIIDDEPHILTVLQKLLTLKGHLVDTAENGDTGCNMCEMFSYDLVITDIIMPERDGFEVIRELNQKAPRTRIIAISGGTARLGCDALLATAALMPRCHVLSKPLDFTVLLDFVDTELES
jgi:DNA-binding response OmpR family regulator